MSHEYKSPFRGDVTEYERDIDTVKGYKDQMATLLRIETGEDEETCAKFIENYLEGKDSDHKYPMCKVFVRDQKTGDRHTKHVPVDQLFKKTIQSEIITSPSLTFYLPERIKRSKLSEFMEKNVAKRAVVKGEMFAAKAAKNSVLATNKKNEQNAVKTLNNGSSGAFSSPYTILYNQTSHSALTSTCRTATSYGNAANERLLGGTRHYYNHAAVINHFLSVATLTDMSGLLAVMTKYDIHYPTVDETLDVVHHSTQLYCINKEADEQVKEFIGKSSPLERAAFVYMGDFFHLAKYNDALMRKVLGSLIDSYTEEEIKDYDAVGKSIDGDQKIILSQLYPELIAVGGNFNEIKNNHKEEYQKVLHGALGLQKAINRFADFFKCFLTNKNLPPSISRMPEVIRRVGVVSDTDSTMMAVGWWSEWFSGNYSSVEATKVADMMIYLSVQHISHLMASMSANMGVAQKRIFLYAMKNEFKFSSFALTTKAKHYFALITSCEGTIYPDAELEVKGVSLRTSNIPPIVMDRFKATIKRLSKEIAEGKKLELLPVLEEVAEVEHNVVDSINSGDASYLKTIGIKSRDAYSDDREGNYHYHRFYNAVFGNKYGLLAEPPYDAYRLPVNLNTKTEINAWIESIEDAEIKNGAIAWFAANPKRTYRQLVLPDYLISNYGIPKELRAAANPRRTAFATVEPYYHVLECLGVYMMNEHRTMLLSDYYGTGEI